MNTLPPYGNIVMNIGLNMEYIIIIMEIWKYRIILKVLDHVKQFDVHIYGYGHKSSSFFQLWIYGEVPGQSPMDALDSEGDCRKRCC